MTAQSVEAILAELRDHPGLAGMATKIERAYRLIAERLAAGGTLFICGNGGSMSDAQHIAGELLKSFVLPRPISPSLRDALLAQPDGAALAEYLQTGLRVHVLGLNPALNSAVANDIPLPGVGFAQELLSLASPGDVLLGISTSGRSRSVVLAAQLAQAMGASVIGLTGDSQSSLSSLSDVALRVPARETYLVQELHLALYHRLCLLLEAHFYG